MKLTVCNLGMGLGKLSSALRSVGMVGIGRRPAAQSNVFDHLFLKPIEHCLGKRLGSSVEIRRPYLDPSLIVAADNPDASVCHHISSDHIQHCAIDRGC